MDAARPKSRTGRDLPDTKQRFFKGVEVDVEGEDVETKASFLGNAYTSRFSADHQSAVH